MYLFSHGAVENYGQRTLLGFVSKYYRRQSVAANYLGHFLKEKSLAPHPCYAFFSGLNTKAKAMPTTSAKLAKINQHVCQSPTR